MRRALLAAAVALPASALAAQSAAPGRVIEVDHHDATYDVSYVDAAACASGGFANLEWNVFTVSGGFTPTGTYQIWASDTAPATSGSTAGQCPDGSPAANPPVHSSQVGAAAVVSSIQDEAVSGAAIAQAANVTCDAASEGRVIHLCVHQVDNGTVLGSASGRLVVQVLAPDPPTLASVGTGDGTLFASFEPSPAGGAAADHFVARATPVGVTAPEYWSPPTTSSAATISGLENGVEYDVVVFAVSVGGNASAPSNALAESPVAWVGTPPVRHGCGSGAAGAPALVGALALALLRRRAR